MKLYPVTLYIGDIKIGVMSNREAIDYLNEKGYKHAITGTDKITGEKIYRGLLKRDENLRELMKNTGYKHVYLRKIPR